MCEAGDFSLTYHWVGASLPPPYHYEYEIRVQHAGEGELRLWPDYPESGAPEWRENFLVSTEQLEHILRLAGEKLFELTWRRRAEPSVGSEAEWMSLRAGGSSLEIPPDLPSEQAAQIQPVYMAVRALVPESLWLRLQERRHEYAEQ